MQGSDIELGLKMYNVEIKIELGLDVYRKGNRGISQIMIKLKVS